MAALDHNESIHKAASEAAKHPAVSTVHKKLAAGEKPTHTEVNHASHHISKSLSKYGEGVAGAASMGIMGLVSGSPLRAVVGAGLGGAIGVYHGNKQNENNKKLARIDRNIKKLQEEHKQVKACIVYDSPCHEFLCDVLHDIIDKLETQQYSRDDLLPFDIKHTICTRIKHFINLPVNIIPQAGVK